MYSIGVLPYTSICPFQYNSVIHTHSTLEEVNLSTHLLVGVKLLIELSLTWNYNSQNVPTDVSYACFKNLVKTHLITSTPYSAF